MSTKTTPSTRSSLLDGSSATTHDGSPQIVVRDTTLSKRVASARAKVAALSRSRASDDSELVAAKRNLKANRVEEYVARVVDEAPKLSRDQLECIAALLRGGAR